MKKIVFFHPSSELYGADKILIYILRQYNDYCREVVLRTNGPLIKLIESECPDVNIKVFPNLPIIAKKNLNIKGMFQFLISLYEFKNYIKIILKNQPDIIYLNTLAVLPILFFIKNNNLKKIIHVHEILKNNNFFHRLINKYAKTHADALICVSKAVRQNFITDNDTEINKKLKLVYNGINFKVNYDNINPRNNFKVDESKINFALIGRIKPTHKGQLLLVDAINFIDSKDLIKVHFYLVGSTVPGQEYMEDEVVKKIKENNLQEKITIIPFVKNIEEIYRKIDVVIVPSVFDDPFPTTVLEGMFFSKPIIGTDVGGIPEMIENGITGLIAKRNDSYDLSKKILFFINNKNEILDKGKEGRKRFLKYFSENSFSEKYKEIMEEILS